MAMHCIATPQDVTSSKTARRTTSVPAAMESKAMRAKAEDHSCERRADVNSSCASLQQKVIHLTRMEAKQPQVPEVQRRSQHNKLIILKKLCRHKTPRH